jgi:hypothetical protein
MAMRTLVCMAGALAATAAVALTTPPAVALPIDNFSATQPAPVEKVFWRGGGGWHGGGWRGGGWRGGWGPGVVIGGLAAGALVGGYYGGYYGPYANGYGYGGGYGDCWRDGWGRLRCY